MGWNITIVTDRPVTLDDADAIVQHLPETLAHPFFPRARCDWGWKMAADIWLPDAREPNKWRIGGSYTQSGHIAVQMANTLAHQLGRRGYHVNTIDTSGYY